MAICVKRGPIHTRQARRASERSCAIHYPGIARRVRYVTGGGSRSPSVPECCRGVSSWQKGFVITGSVHAERIGLFQTSRLVGSYSKYLLFKRRVIFLCKVTSSTCSRPTAPGKVAKHVSHCATPATTLFSLAPSGFHNLPFCNSGRFRCGPGRVAPFLHFFFYTSLPGPIRLPARAIPGKGYKTEVNRN